ncbi:DNA-binding transcriptional LysR family regulator [Paraburkholderia bannensis]|uniref:DNA-binding transcriptional LysR family regulator n=1 Tax=Paraburkholderia bannensis TaxID=765414 RepID=A0A7W9U4M5_9BURK|nr:MULTISPECIES: LysR substrate-binding domain-containing protein [Paraburkholderia]MBB3261943.1 DNA-binding transcriptional LysR family regulator [Paraburkholderia sp. WP4_3_2]MBB6106936.1 DNA-binding transcriptional LysR family regulator [Paraburkholderia bannensis]
MKTSTDELLVFVTVIDAGSITAAAEKLQQTVSGVSRALTRLEKQLGVALILRTTRRLQLTEEGELFLERARAILAAMEDAEEAVTRHREQPSGRLRVDAATPFMLHCIVPHMTAFAARYPDIQLELTSNERIVDLLEQRVDIAIRIGALQDSTLHARSLGVSRRRVVASPAYLKAHGTPRTLQALHAHRLIGFTAPAQLNRWPLRLQTGPASGDSNGAESAQGAQGALFGDDANEGLAIHPALAASSGETIRQLALGDAGIACLSDFMTAADRAAGRLVTVLDDALLAERQPIHAVYYRSAALAARVQCFLAFIAGRLEP